MKEYDILLFDVKGYSKESVQRQLEIREALKTTIVVYFKTIARKFETTSTGDGYYISVINAKDNHIVLLDLIAYLISELEDIEIRFALHTGTLKDYTDINNTRSLIGSAFNDLNRFLAGVTSANIILVSRTFYEKFIHGVLISKKRFDVNRTVVTYKMFAIHDKHNKQFEIYNIGYLKDSMEYGFEYTEDDKNIGRDDIIEFEDFKKIIEFSFGRKKATILKKVEQSKPSVYYCYLVIEISQYTKEYFLFIKNNSVKTQTVDHFVSNNKVTEPLTICANNKHLDEMRDEFWKNDLIQKFQKTAPSIKKFSFKYIDDYLWENCIPDSVKRPVLFDEESNFINPEYSIQSNGDEKKINIEDYLLKFIKTDSMPIAILKGSGGMGKTTLLKRVSDLLMKNQNYRKSVFYIDGQNIAKYLYRSEELNLEKIDTISSLLRFYFSTLSSTGVSINSEAPILLNDELVDIIISSGNIVIMIDGLDEISGFLKENFSLNIFISDIVNINKILNHSKIIISTRDYYWDNEISKIDAGLIDNFKIITLNGFNEKMAEEYFEKKFLDSAENKRKSFAVLKSLTKSKPITDYYWPFLVYLVSDIVLKEQSSNTSFSDQSIDVESKYLDLGVQFDNIVINFCLREKQRQNLDLEIDDFIDLFREVVIDNQGEMKLPDFKDYISLMLPSISNATTDFEGFKTLLINPLLKERNGKVVMSIDFIQFHLTAAFLSYFIGNNIHSTSIYKVLSRYYDGKEDILKDVVTRLRKKKRSIDSLSGYLSKITGSLKKDKISESERLILQRAISTILYISFRLFDSRSNVGANERTELLKELFSNELDNIHIFGDFYTLDFSSLKIRNSSFNYFSNFFKSTRNDDTLLIDTRVEISHVFGAATPNSWNASNFDKSCILSSDLKIILKTTRNNKLADIYAIKKDLSTLFRKFQKSGRFIFQMETHLEFFTNSKVTFPQLLNEMLHYKVVSNKAAKEPYNWGVVDSYKDSISQLLQNNHVDANLDKVLFLIYSKFYS